MKIAKLLRASAGFVLMAVILISAAGCKKSKTQPDSSNLLYGSWYETNLAAPIGRSIYFDSNNKFTTTIAQNGVNPSVSIYTGTYMVKNDSLRANITEEKVMQNNVLISTKAININLYDKGTYSISNNKLTIKYITYPADAPVSTEATFQRQLPD